MIVYNSRLNDLEQWWGQNRPSKPEEEITPQDSYMENVGFDYE